MANPYPVIARYFDDVGREFAKEEQPSINQTHRRANNLGAEGMILLVSDSTPEQGIERYFIRRQTGTGRWGRYTEKTFNDWRNNG